jgi:EAL domain-containing protein (putative c-di-GMP-specific phosphodiesterase class I)
LSSNRELEAESIIRDADTAMYRAKSEGRDRYEIFDGSMYDSALRGFRLEMDLRKAIERHEFFVEYQPIIALTDGRVAGFEALVRWEHPELGRISPGDFVPVAEETGLIVALGEWVMDRAVDQAARWQREFSHRGELIMSVNLAARQFRHRSLVSDIKHCLDSSGLAASRLKLEITESSLIEDPGESMGLMQELKQLGTRLSIDDFGTGYSSLSYLHRFPFDMLKVDRSFVTGMTESEDSRKIVTNIISLAQNLEKVCISEGVEKASEADYLRSLGCEFAQGFLYSQALPAGKAASMLETSPVFSRSGTAAT